MRRFHSPRATGFGGAPIRLARKTNPKLHSGLTHTNELDYRSVSHCSDKGRSHSPILLRPRLAVSGIKPFSPFVGQPLLEVEQSGQITSGIAALMRVKRSLSFAFYRSLLHLLRNLVQFGRKKSFVEVLPAKLVRVCHSKDYRLVSRKVSLLIDYRLQSPCPRACAHILPDQGV